MQKWEKRELNTSLEFFHLQLLVLLFTQRFDLCVFRGGPPLKGRVLAAGPVGHTNARQNAAAEEEQ